MFHSPSLSPRGSLTDPQSTASGRGTPSQPRYFRDHNGKLKYTFEVDLNGFPEENIRVTNVRNIIAIDAKFVDTDVSGDERTHELRRELYLPSNVNANTVTCVLNADGTLVVEADATEQKQRPLSPPNSAHMNRLSTASYLASPTRFTNLPPPIPRNFDRGNFCCLNSSDPRRITFAETESSAHLSSRNQSSVSRANRQPHIFDKPPIPSHISFAKPPTESILKSSQNRRPVKNVRLVAPPSVNQSSIDSDLKPSGKPCISFNPERPVRQNLYFPCGNVVKSDRSNSLYGNKLYTLRVDVGPYIRPEDLSVSVQNGVVVINAKRFMSSRNAHSEVKEPKRIIHEHRSEHTLPAYVNPIDLICRLDNGLVTIEAPLSISSSQTSMLSSFCKEFSHASS
ncbi:hypothetical protein FGIG_05316 [Fasciola gigantica]|uniref:SHSP domain-containing protein n=1 Tax=Fasciola gigantica TaxID=46835 RepID=A0A504YJ90_FASGI|nr:hypothetical protein FGIG_05316 [Fasciola gigantica]